MASKEFQFHYVKTPTGSISGQSVLTQTEDAINDLGDYMVDATADATEALNKGSSSKALFNFAPRELLSITQAKFLRKRLFRVLLKSFLKPPKRSIRRIRLSRMRLKRFLQPMRLAAR